MAKIKLLWKAPNVAIAQRGPRYLEYLNREGKTEFYAPEMDEDGHITYDVDEEYGRRLLAGQADRFFLLSPQKLIIKRKRPDNLGSEYSTVHAIGKASAALKKLKEGDQGQGKPAENPQDGPKDPGGTTDHAQGTDKAPEGATGSVAGLPGENPAGHGHGKDQAGQKGGNKPKATA